MLVFIILIAAALMALFVGVALAGNRAQDRQNARIVQGKAKRAEVKQQDDGAAQ